MWRLAFVAGCKDKPHLTMMPNTMVANNPPMNPSHVFLGDSCGGHNQGVLIKFIMLLCTVQYLMCHDIWCLSWMLTQWLTTIITNLNERGAAEEETKHVRHNVITDHTGNWHDEPIGTEEEFSSYKNKLYEARKFEKVWVVNHVCMVHFLYNRVHQREEGQAKLYSIRWDEWTVYSPDHALKQVVNNEVRLSHHNQQSHMSPTKLWEKEIQINQVCLHKD